MSSEKLVIKDDFEFDEEEDDNEKISLDLPKVSDNNKVEEDTKINVNTELNIIKDNDVNAQDKLLLRDMGFNPQLIDRIYRKVFPTNIEEALDYLQKDDNDKFTHSYIADNLNLCSICGNIRSAHAGESDFLDIIARDRNRIRERDRTFSTENKFKSTYNKYSYNNYGKKECGVCSDEINSADLSKVRLPCKHFFSAV